jgi:hypothetical protein
VLRDPRLRVTTVGLPRALPNITSYLHRCDMQDRVTLFGHNVHRPPWPIVDCNVVLFATFLHCDDDARLGLLRESFRMLPDKEPCTHLQTALE